MPVGFEKTLPIFHHQPLHCWVQLQVLCSNEEIDLWWILIERTSYRTSGNSGNNGHLLELIVGRGQDDKASRDKSLALLPSDLLADATEAEGHANGYATTRTGYGADVDLRRTSV